MGGSFHFVSPAAVDEPKMSSKQLLQEIKADRLPEPMVGDSVERGWAEAMRHFIEKKLRIAQKPGYRPHDKQWLAIYDSWPSPALELQHAVALLQEQFVTSDPFGVFDRIFILTREVMVDLARDHAHFQRLNHCQPATPARTGRRQISPSVRCGRLRPRHLFR